MSTLVNANKCHINYHWKYWSTNGGYSLYFDKHARQRPESLQIITYLNEKRKEKKLRLWYGAAIPSHLPTFEFAWSQKIQPATWKKFCRHIGNLKRNSEMIGFFQREKEHEKLAHINRYLSMD